MRRQEYIDLMYANSADIDAKTKLWQAVHNGNYNKFKELIDANTLPNINEYRFGVTLLHALVLNDKCSDSDDNEEIYKNKAQIAQSLLSLGADLFALAHEGAPWPIKVGDTPLIYLEYASVHSSRTRT